MTEYVEMIGTNVIVIVVMTLVIIIGTVVIKRTREDLVTPSEENPRESLASFREAYERGQMSEVEYRRILNAMEGPRTNKPPSPPS